MDKRIYNSIHDFLRKNKKGIFCEHCGCCDKKLDNALIHGKDHKKDVDNYIKLCRKCHYKYDHADGYKHTESSKERISKASKERIKKNGVSEKFIKSRFGKKISTEHKKIISINMSGENHHQSKLTEKDVLFIRKSILKPTELALKYNVTYRTIHNIIKKKTWKNLD